LDWFGTIADSELRKRECAYWALSASETSRELIAIVIPSDSGAIPRDLAYEASGRESPAAEEHDATQNSAERAEGR
jgi:hypothetical protein